jgi:hypothetical protein
MGIDMFNITSYNGANQCRMDFKEVIYKEIVLSWNDTWRNQNKGRGI